MKADSSSDDLVSLGSYRLEPSSSSAAGRRASGGRMKREGNGGVGGNPMRSVGFDVRPSWGCLSMVPGMLLTVAVLGMSGGVLTLVTSLFTVRNPTGRTEAKDRAYISDERQVIKLIQNAMASYKGRQWPISVRDEEDDFELLSHPAATDGGERVKLPVPRFYFSDEATLSTASGSNSGSTRQPLGDGRLLTRKVVNMIGSHSTEAGRQKDDVDTRTIYVSISSFRDWRCRVTIESIFGRAKYPDRIRVGVVDQTSPDFDPSCDVAISPCDTHPNQALCKYHQNIDVYELEASLAVGPTFARHIGNRMYRGEYYALQIDAHTTFVQDWDADIITQFEEAKNDMAVLSTYLFDAEGSIDLNTGSSIRQSRYLICNAVYKGIGLDRRLHHDISEQPEGVPRIRGSPQLQPYWSADFSFSRGHFILTVPYDPHLPMVEKEDEEISMAIRAFTHGYDFYAPERNVCFHNSYDTEGAPTPRSFSENAELYIGKHTPSIERLLGLIGMGSDAMWNTNDKDLYGVGKVRVVAKFFTCFGIHVGEKITEHKLCDYVSGGALHKNFIQHLRSDGMGIDYSKIQFRFHELLRVHEIENRR